MKYPKCASTHIRKNGKQNHICVKCGRQFIDSINRRVTKKK